MLRNVELRPLFLAAVVGLVAVLSAGCATETRIKATPDTPRPTWTMIPPEPSDGNRFYVGIGLADNALNEAEGRRLALTNAAELAAQSIATDVESVLTETEGREGPAHKGKNVAKGDVLARVRAKAKEIVRGMQPQEYYYERWKIRESFLGRAFTRYKYYVLTAYPEKEYDRLVDEVAK